MPSKPKAFPHFKDCISFETSQGQKLMGVFMDGSQQGFNFSLHILAIVTVTQVIQSELVF
jgi:hypothetical protein